MSLQTVTIDLGYFVLSVVGDVALFACAGLIVGSFVDGLVTAVQVIRR